MGPARHRAATLWATYDYPKSLRSFLGQNDNLKPCVVLTITVRCPYGDRTMSLRCVYGLRAYDFFQICHCAELNKIVEATMPVNLYTDRKVSLRRPRGNGDLDIVQAWYTRRKANVTEASMTNSSLMKVEKNAECSPWSVLQYF